MKPEVASRHALITGCGYVGQATARLLLDAGWTVSAITRNAVMAAQLEAAGVHVWCGNLDSEAWHSWATSPVHTLIHTVSAASPDLAGYRRSYLDGLASILKWAGSQDQPPRRAAYTSSTSVYPHQNEEWVDETSETGGSPTAEVLLEAEAKFLAGPWRAAYVFRLSGIYGPERHRLLDALRRGEREFPASPAWLNLIHRDDISSMLAGVATGSDEALPASGIYNLTDGSPERKDDLIRWLASQLGLPEPDFIEGKRPSGPVRPTGRGANRRIKNDRLRSTWNWEPRFPDYRAGYRTLL
jgi:nucleoside-diphosphate-sugar epimerase